MNKVDQVLKKCWKGNWYPRSFVQSLKFDDYFEFAIMRTMKRFATRLFRARNGMSAFSLSNIKISGIFDASVMLIDREMLLS